MQAHSSRKSSSAETDSLGFSSQSSKEIGGSVKGLGPGRRLLQATSKTCCRPTNTRSLPSGFLSLLAQSLLNWPGHDGTCCHLNLSLPRSTGGRHGVSPALHHSARRARPAPKAKHRDRGGVRDLRAVKFSASGCCRIPGWQERLEGDLRQRHKTCRLRPS